MIIKDDREIVDLPESVVVLAKIDDKVLMVKNYRPATSSHLLELPAGWVEAGETPERAAARELEEETGYRASNMVFLLSFYLSPGYSSERMYLYKAEGLIKVREPTEVEEVLTYDPKDLINLMNKGEIKDAKTLVALLFNFRILYQN